MHFFVVNAVSGNGRGQEVWAYIKRRLHELDLDYQVRFTQSMGNATEIVNEVKHLPGLKAIVAIGGDGTINEVGSGLIGTSVPMGIIPAGTGNDFALGHQIPFDPEYALKRILKHETYQVDTAKINNRYMISFGGTGFDALVADAVQLRRWQKQWFGRLTYGIEALKIFRSFTPRQVTITVDGVQYEYENVWLIAISNIPNYAGGIKICPQAQNNDGLLDLCCIQNLNSFQFLRLFPTAYSGKHVQHRSVVLHRGKEFTISPQHSFIAHVDGEILKETPITVKVVPRSLTVL
ncbi:diacylglycerol/lipid kinase family protein [Thermoactinomyces mirandus]|uniref:Diacylglycerol kinase family lipid kinase n=1 Tax=Thermoactinomyces mirandus TaxID=2756294 RepID=A0A7W1XRF9_9BACL|nr:diacylglycerol kinase family protein [Thermoactinomyces mirandus]MBA4601948.1 diacylglycerol kinase family lipid kinase [Thermoactinomyces mirandus]